MENITKKITDLLRHRVFISVATCDLNNKPNAAPKFILKVKDGHIYLVDYTLGRTWQNLKINPRVSLSLVDNETLTGYQVNGPVHIIDSGADYESLLKELSEKKIDLSIKRIIEGIHTGKRHKNFELSLPEHFIIFRVTIKEVAEIGSSGNLNREQA